MRWTLPVRLLMRMIGAIEVAQVRWFGRSLLSTLYGTSVLVLHTEGRRSGRARSTPLAVHRRDDGSLMIVGGAAGKPTTPDWVANLRSTPGSAVTIDRRRIEVTAREVTGDERVELWADAVRLWPRTEVYRRRSGRRIPIFILSEVDPMA